VTLMFCIDMEKTFDRIRPLLESGIREGLIGYADVHDLLVDATIRDGSLIVEE